MQLVAGGQRTGRGEPHAGNAGPQAVQGRGSVELLPGINRLDDQTHALLLTELKLADGLQHTLGEDGFSDLYHATPSPLEGMRLRVHSTAPELARSGRVEPVAWE